ncbi:MAG: archaellin/type IV pilin N-terminal domain-containing protein [Halolamina sp.]
MSAQRGISPVIGVVLMLLITLLLASVFAAGATLYGNSLDSQEAMPSGPNSTASAASTATDTDGPWVGGSAELFQLSNNDAAATSVSLRVNFTIENGSQTIGNSLNSVYIEVTTGSPDMFSGTSTSDLTTFGIDTDSDGDIDEEISHDIDEWSVQNGGSTLKIGLGGSAYTAQAGDSIIVVFGGVDTPSSAGTYDMKAQTSGDGNWHYGSVTVND